MRIAVLHHEGSFFPLELRSQVGDAAELVWVYDSTVDAPQVVRLCHRLGPAVDRAGADLDATAGALADLEIDGIVTFVDDHIEAAAALAQRLGLRYHTPQVAKVVVNKQAQRATLAQAGIPGPGFWSIPPGVSGEELTALAAEMVFPCVVKAAEGSGSRHMYLVGDVDELRAAVDSSAEASPRGFLVEEYLFDQISDEWFASYLSIESVVREGQATHVAVTGRFPLAPPFRESGNFIPAVVPDGSEDELFALVDRTIAALGITDSITHTEIKLTPKGPRVIEVNGRLGGRPPFVLNKVAEVNLFQAACQVAGGAPIELSGLAPCDGVGFYLMLHVPMEATHLVSVDGIESVEGLDGVESVVRNRIPGTPIDWREGTDAKVVTVQGRVADHAALASTVARIQEAITITTDLDAPQHG